MMIRTTRVMLATALLDHDRANNKPGDLKVFCQRCHMLHDKLEHLRQRDVTYKKRGALGDTEGMEAAQREPVRQTYDAVGRPP